MMGSKNSKRVTWAPDHNLCQVRLFPSAKLHSKVGLGCPLKKALRTVEPDPDVPPGFEKPRIPCKRWRCPARIELNSRWLMAAGGESQEVEAQKQRESRVLEAVFPRPSAIPPNPRLPVNIQESVVDDQSIPVISTTVPEEAEASNVSSNQDQTNLIDPDLLVRILTNSELVELLLTALHQEASAQNTPNPELQPTIPSNSPGVAINGQASLSTPTTKTELNAPTTATTPTPAVPFCPPQLRTGFVSTSDTTSIPIKGQPLLSNPNMRAEVNAPTTATTPPVATFRPPQLGTGFVSTSDTTSIPINGQPLLSNPTMKTELNARTTATASTPAAPFCPPQLRMGFVSSPPVVKDTNYYKSLIQQHGGGGGGCVPPQPCSQSNRLMGGAAQEFRKPTKSRITKPCMFFNSNRGCKNGANCAYQHDVFTSQKRPAFATHNLAVKRVKLGY